MKKTVSQLWDDIFKDYNILNEIKQLGYYKISANTIRKYKEPRLMTKFDFSKQLPEVFKVNHLGIIPINNGEYIIGNYNLFQSISNNCYSNIEPVKKSLPNFIETIDPDNIYSESNALNVALLSGMLKDLAGEDVVETIQGKMRATGFNFEIEGENGKNVIQVEKPAMEIDGGYEGKSKIVLIEAKNMMPSDFVIRQLYFPYRHWINKAMKPVIPVFFAYDNGIYNFFVYNFEDINNYNSLRLKCVKRYVISSPEADDIKKDIYNSIEPENDTFTDEIPFPQADSFNRIIGIIDMISSGINSASDISDEYGFDIRQGNYYISAARYLGFIDKGKKAGEYVLTPIGAAISEVDIKTRNSILIREVLKHSVFYYCYKYYIDRGEKPPKDFIKNLMQKYTNLKNGETLNRRSSTVRGWIEWIIGCQV